MAMQKFGPARIEEIRALEQKYGFRLPNDYVNFLLEYNGGIIGKERNCQVTIKSLNGTIHVDVLYGINTAHENANIDTWMALFRDDMANGSLIIGDSIEHGFLVLICTGEDAGICYWDHAYAFPGSNDETNMFYITSTFGAFVRGLL